jgi:hypothetical protein
LIALAFSAWKLKYDEPVSNFAITFKLRRYTKAKTGSISLATLPKGLGNNCPPLTPA